MKSIYPEIKDPVFKPTYKLKEVNAIDDPVFKPTYKIKEVNAIDDPISKPTYKLKTQPIEVVSSPVPMLNFIMDCCIGKPTIPEVKQELLQEVKERVRPLPEAPMPVYVKPLIKKPDYYAVIHPRPVREMIQEPKEIKVEPKNSVGSREWKKQQFLINNM